MKTCKCGSDRFAAHQVCYHDVVVDGDNDFVEDRGCYESNKPYGPYTCKGCGAVYDELDELDNARREYETTGGTNEEKGVG